MKNNQNLKKYCTNSNFAACGLVLRYGALEDDIRDVLSVIVRKYPYMNFAQIDMRKNFVSIENKLPSRDSDKNAPHFLVLHTHDNVEENQQQIAARAHRGFFTASNVGAFIATTLKKLSQDEDKISYLKEKLLVAKRGGREEKAQKAKEEDKKRKIKSKKRKEEKSKAKEKKKRKRKAKEDGKRRRKVPNDRSRSGAKKRRKQAAAVDSDDDEVDEAESSDEEANPDDPSSIEHKWGDAWNKFNSD